MEFYEILKSKQIRSSYGQRSSSIEGEKWAPGSVISGQKCGQGTRTRAKQVVNRIVAMNEDNSGTAEYVSGNNGSSNAKQFDSKLKNLDDIVKYIESISWEDNQKMMIKKRQNESHQLKNRMNKKNSYQPHGEDYFTTRDRKC